MKHRNKVKKARRMMTDDEILNHVPIFQSKGWEKRRKLRALKESQRFHG